MALRRLRQALAVGRSTRESDGPALSLDVGRPAQLVELVHRAQKLEHAHRLCLIDTGQGEADVNQHIVINRSVRDMLETHALEDSAEVDLAHSHVVFVIGLDDFAGYREAHQRLPVKNGAFVELGVLRVRKLDAGRGHRELAQAQTAIARGNSAMTIDAKLLTFKLRDDLCRQESVLKDAAAQCHCLQSGLSPQPAADLNHDRDQVE